MKPITPLVGLNPPPADSPPKPDTLPLLVVSPPPLSESLRQAIVARAAETVTRGMALLSGLEKGPETGMECRCGGVLHQARPSAERIESYAKLAAGNPPWHRKKRIRKKWARRHEATTLRTARFAGRVLGLGSRSFLCGKCGRVESIYQAAARNMFKVEPLPPGALPIYDRNPDVAAIVTGDGDE